MFSPSLLSFRNVLVAAVICTGAFSLSAMAQQAPAGGGNPPGQPGQGGPGGGRAGFQQRMQERLKEALAVNDDEWKALQPRIQAVQDAQRAASNRGGGFGGGRQRGNRPGGDPNAQPGATPAATPPDRQPTAVEVAAKALQDTLDNKSATPDDIKAKLTALREAKTAAKADLSKAQDSLRELLTARQEAVLVGYGMLE